MTLSPERAIQDWMVYNKSNVQYDIKMYELKNKSEGIPNENDELQIH